MENKMVFMFLVLTMVSNIATGYGADAEAQNYLLPDTDGDGANDYADQFPFDNLEIKDTDGDGWGDNSDYCPHIPDRLNADFDNDKIGDVCDFDDDNDGIEDSYDLDATGNAIKNYTIIMVATKLMDSKKNQPDEPFLIIQTPFSTITTHIHSGHMANATLTIDVDDDIRSLIEVNVSAWDSDNGVNEDDYYGDCLIYIPSFNSCRGDNMRVLSVDTNALLNDIETQEQVSQWVASETPTPKENYVMGGFFGTLWNNLMGFFDGFTSADNIQNIAMDWIINTFVSNNGVLLLI
jgi:hypothetical protein